MFMVFIWYLHKTQNEDTSAFEPMFYGNRFTFTYLFSLLEILAELEKEKRRASHCEMPS